MCLSKRPQRPEGHCFLGPFAISPRPAAQTTDLVDAVRDFDQHFEVELDKQKWSQPDRTRRLGGGQG